MNENYRHKQLLDLLDERKMLSTSEIITLLNISPATARRDISKLSEQGRLKKVRNGAETLNNSPKSPYYNFNDINNVEEKRRIAIAASRLCKDGESIVLTCGSTMFMLGNALCGRDLQIITNFLPLANYLIEQDHEDIVIVGGQYNKKKSVTLSLNTQNDMNYSANIMFSSGRGFTTDGLFKTDMIIAHSEKRMSSKANKYVVLLDSSKLGQQVGMLFTELKKIDLLITGNEANSEIVSQLRDAGLEVILA